MVVREYQSQEAGQEVNSILPRDKKESAKLVLAAGGQRCRQRCILLIRMLSHLARTHLPCLVRSKK